jgi:hypothetical protein
MKHKIALLFSLFVLVIGSFYTFSQSVGRDIPPGCGVIRGRVIDQNSVPVSGVRVYAMVADHPPRATSSDVHAITDENGAFFLGCAEPGRNGVYTVKEDDFYPDTFLTPFVDPRFFTAVDVTDQQVVRGVEVYLPPKAGKLNIRVRDARSEKPIDGVVLTICRSNESVKLPGPECSVLTNLPESGFSRLLPAMAYMIKASAPGYQDWYYGSDGSKKHMEVMQLTPKMTKNLIIALRQQSK